MVIAPKRLTNEDRVLDYLFMRKRARRKLTRLAWLFAGIAVMFGLYLGSDIGREALDAIAVFVALWVGYFVVTKATQLFRTEEAKLIVMERFILEQGYAVRFDELEGKWMVEKELK